jgi:hypothetical protein
MYAMLGTHPELAHPITILSQHSTMPGPPHFTALNCVFRYLCGVSNMNITYRSKLDYLELSGYVDADWANDINDCHSVGGHVFLLAGGAISWSAQKQRIIVQSSTEAEYIAGALAADESIWLHR